MIRLLLSFALLLLMLSTATGQGVLPEIGEAFDLQTDDATSLREGTVRCSVLYITEPIIAAAEAGVLLQAPSEGQVVEVDEVIARTDDRDAKYAAEAAGYVVAALQKELASQIRLEYSKAQMDVYKVNLEKALQANQRTPGAIPDIDVRQRRFQYKEGQLSLKNTIHERSITEINISEKKAEYQRAVAMLDRHQVKSPIRGMVAEVEKRKGEYVRPGDPIARLVQLHRVRVAAKLAPSEYPMDQMIGRNVRIEINLGGGRTEALEGVISFASPRIDSGGRFEVWAEVDAPAGNLRQGMEGTMQLF